MTFDATMALQENSLYRALHGKEKLWIVFWLWGVALWLGWFRCFNSNIFLKSKNRRTGKLLPTKLSDSNERSGSHDRYYPDTNQ